MRTYRPRFFCFPGFRATSVAAESEPALHNLLIFHRIIKRFEKKLKGILFGEIDYFLAAFPGILHAHMTMVLSFGEHPANEQIQAIVNITERNKAIAFLTIMRLPP